MCSLTSLCVVFFLICYFSSLVVHSKNSRVLYLWSRRRLLPNRTLSTALKSLLSLTQPEAVVLSWKATRLANNLLVSGFKSPHAVLSVNQSVQQSEVTLCSGRLFLMDMKSCVFRPRAARTVLWHVLSFGAVCLSGLNQYVHLEDIYPQIALYFNVCTAHITSCSEGQ